MTPLALLRSFAFATAVATSCASVSAQVPSPKEFLGHEVGADYFLANYGQLLGYWTAVAKASDRVQLETIGETSYGQPMVMAVISSPANLAKLDEFRLANARLARGRDVDERVVDEIVDGAKSVIWIDAGMHATESVAAQNIIELVWRMASGSGREIEEILDNVVLLVCPANPDGMEMIANAYMATRRVGGIPVLYQRYIGHDNNRDFYACNLPETRAIANQLYRTWYPQVVYNHHQSAPRGTIIFTPPFRDPFNHNVDPLVMRGIDLVASHMNHRFASEGKPGVISRSGASYSTWWNGGLRTTVYFHNMVGILTEVFGHPTPTRVTQSLRRRLPYTDYPDPVASQEWHARQTIEYLQTANFAILTFAARYRRELLKNAWRMARRSIERGSRAHWTVTPKLMAIARQRDRRARGADDEDGRSNGEGATDEVVDPFADPALQDARAYVMPADADDFPAAVRFARSLLRTGVEVERAKSAVRVAGQTFPAGSLVVSAAQAFRPHVRDMFEPQWHPDDLGTGGEPVRPYDSAGWTLAMQMGVDYRRFVEPVVGDLEEVDVVELPFAPRSVSASAAGWVFSHANSNGFIAANRLLASGDRVFWLHDEATVRGRTWPAGTVFVPADRDTRLRVEECARELGVAFEGVDTVPAGAASKLRPIRIGLFDVWGGNMPTGWTQWVLEQFEFPVQLVFGSRLEDGALRDDFDVLLFCTGLPAASERDRIGRALRGGGRSATSDENVQKLIDTLPPFENWSRIGERRVRLTRDRSIPALREFVEQGGVVLAFGRQATTLARHFELPLRNGPFLDGKDGRRATSSEFFIPGSLVSMDVDTTDPLGYGLSSPVATMFRRSEVYDVRADEADAATARLQTVGAYAKNDVLASGWAIGEELLVGKSAVVRAELGAGKVYLFGPDVLYRGQPLGTFKLVFNAIQGGTARTVRGVDGDD